ncbi:MAG: plasmid pRiA4b ORF-3 family protein [Gammaproteobacteria bacterium]|nr:plasmid pRiA4b ORF-3 family protein [Gammaproteobacteria bacterium]
MILTFTIEFPNSRDDDEEDMMRKIEIESSSTLDDLHLAIQQAIDFDNDHMYEFFVSKNTRSRRKTTYDIDSNDVFDITLDDIYPIEAGNKLFYLFDYGDSWIFKITKTRKTPESAIEGVLYPRVIESIGENPEQYEECD